MRADELLGMEIGLSNKVIDEISLKKSDREKSVMSTFIPTFPVN